MRPPATWQVWLIRVHLEFRNFEMQILGRGKLGTASFLISKLILEFVKEEVYDETGKLNLQMSTMNIMLVLY